MSERVIVDKADLVVMADAVRSVTGSTEPMDFSTLASSITNNVSSYKKQWELVVDKTFSTEDTAEPFYFQTDLLGNPFDFEAVKILLTVPGGKTSQTYYICPYCGDNWLLWDAMVYNKNNQTEDTRTCYGSVVLKPDGYGGWEGWYTYEITVPHAVVNKFGNPAMAHKSQIDLPNITQIYFSCSDVPHPDTRVQIYAVRR